VIAWALVLILAIALAVVSLRLRVHRSEANRLSEVRKHLLDRNDGLRNELTIAAAERDAAVAGFEAANADAGQLRAQRDQIAAENAKLRISFRNQLGTAAAEQASYLMNRPHPHRTREERERDAWNSRMRAVFDAPSRIPPHEQRQDGADQ
jgi:uncharacterized coiled-coil DUF342 family protein